MFAQDIYDPLSEYVNVFRDRFKQIAEETFEQLSKEAEVDVEANRKTCRQIYRNQELLSSIKSKIGWMTALSVLLWVGIGSGIGVLIALYEDLLQDAIIGITGGIVAALMILFIIVYPYRKKLKSKRDELDKVIAKLKSEAWAQMEPLNRLYDWDILTRMMSRAVPKLEFDPYFTTQRLADLKEVYNWDGSFNNDRSVIYSHSGLINGNPFVLCRTRKMHMGSKTYYGSKTIHWTTQERGSDGHYHTVHHSQTLTASVTAPYPEYPETTRLIYGNTAAPDLIFHRRQSGLAGREGSLAYKSALRSLRKKARNLENADFAMLTNEDFEVAFNTSDRNNNQQFALLFTPLAQESMLKLLKDKSAGYGDDFRFDKNRMINVILPEHLQNESFDMNPSRYRNFDFDKAKKNFHTLNAEYFRAIYFSLAPLLCVPMYQQIRPQHDIYGHDMQRRSAFWEHEALANFWGDAHFSAPSCVTPCILKTTEERGEGDSSTIQVTAYGYESHRRLTYIQKWGGDGRLHDVPVYWNEYLPVTGHGQMQMQEDNGAKEDFATQTDRLSHISDVLTKSRLSLYRRHIASRAE